MHGARLSTVCWRTPARPGGPGRRQYRRAMAKLFAPMSAVAARNPFATSRVGAPVDGILTVDADNRMICDPYHGSWSPATR